MGDKVLLVNSEMLGRGNDELGGILMRNFFHALNQAAASPEKVIFVNSGVKLATRGSDILEELQALSEKGVRFYSCGTCLQFFDLKDALAIGEVTNMRAIVETLVGPASVVTI